MDAGVEIALIGMIGSVVSAALAAVAVYLGTKNKEHLVEISRNVDGQLTEVIALKEAVSFSKGADRERDKQAIKEGIREGFENGGTIK
jgi:hypothetical protein